MSYAVLGVDPGTRGGMALIRPDGTEGFIDLWAFRPELTAYDLEQMVRQAVNVLMHYKKRAMFLEKVGYKRGDGGKGAFTFGRVVGLLEGMALAHGLVVHRVAPVIWQSSLECLSGGNKNVTKRRASALFPLLHERKLITHATADALLIAEYGRRYLGRISGGPRPVLFPPTSERGARPSSPPQTEPTLAEWREKRALDLEKDERRP